MGRDSMPNGATVVTDPDDPRVSDFRHLTDMDFRRRMESPAGLFIAEGFLVLERVVAKGLPIRDVLIHEKRLDRVSDILDRLPTALRPTVVVADESVLRSITGFDVHRGVLASVQRPTPLSAVQIWGTGGHIAVLEGLVDPTNVGLAFRSAAAMGFTGCLLSADCADPLYRRAIRTSMGAVLDLPWGRCPPGELDFTELRSAGLRTIALSPGPEHPTLDDVLDDFAGQSVAAIFGSEGEGISRRLLTRVDAIARIPMAAGIDSLNVAATVAVVGYALRCANGT